jgi:hypothetical protein
VTTTPEALTPEERAHLQLVASMTREGDRAGGALAKLLRIHDRQVARIEELEGTGPRPLHFEFISGEDMSRLEWEASDDEDAPDGVSEPLVRKLIAAFMQALTKLIETRQLLEHERARRKTPT